MAADLVDLHRKAGEAPLHFLPDRAIAQDQRLRSEQLALARRILQPFAAVLRADHLAIALGLGEHQHDDIFGDRHGVDPGPVGQHHAAFAQQIEREHLDPGENRVEPLEPGGEPERLGHVGARIHIEPADLRLGRQGKGLILGRIPARLGPIGQVRLDQGPEQGVEHGDGHWELRKLSSIGGRCRHSAKLNGRVVSGGTRAASGWRGLR